MRSSIRTRPSPSLAIALLALFVGLGGTTFAVQQSGDNGVSPKAREAAKKVKRGPAGPQGPQGPQGLQGLQGIGGPQGIPGPTYANFAGVQNPPSPYNSNVFGTAVSTPTAGRLLVIGTAQITPDCTTGNGVIGLYVDGVGVPGTLRSTPGAPPTPAPTLVVAVGVTAASVPAGTHEVAIGDDCPGGTGTGGTAAEPSLGAVLLGS